MADFSKSKIGDPCWDIILGEGELFESDDSLRPIKAVFPVYGAIFYEYDGREHKVDRIPRLYHDKPRITEQCEMEKEK